MLSAGKRTRNRVRFERQPVRTQGRSAYASWDEAVAVAVRWAAFRPQFGREQVEAGRLQSTMQGTLTVLADSLTRTIAAEDRAVFICGPYAGKIGNIKSIIPTPDNREIEMTLEIGAAT